MDASFPEPGTIVKRDMRITPDIFGPEFETRAQALLAAQDVAEERRALIQYDLGWFYLRSTPSRYEEATVAFKEASERARKLNLMELAYDAEGILSVVPLEKLLNVHQDFVDSMDGPNSPNLLLRTLHSEAREDDAFTRDFARQGLRLYWIRVRLMMMVEAYDQLIKDKLSASEEDDDSELMQCVIKSFTPFMTHRLRDLQIQELSIENERLRRRLKNPESR